MRALVAMSGGVDSSVAAALMLEEGHEVVGVTLKQWQGRDGRMPTAGCCTLADATDARRVCAQLDVPYYVLDYVDEFRREVVDPFAAAYAAGHTPNPCVECNRRVRFRALLGRTAALGCDVLVTGHHARVTTGPEGCRRLRRGRDRGKDQSYVLHMLGAADLARVRFPVGEMTKDRVRAHAARLGLRTAAKPDSQDICFVGDGDYRDFLVAHHPGAVRAGPVVDTAGRELGSHEGVAGFTIGQRKGLGIAVGEPRYVVAIDGATATVTVGGAADLLVSTCRVDGVSWVAGRAPADRSVAIQVRYRSDAVPGRIEPAVDPGSWRAVFAAPVAAVAPGQAAVFYRGDEVLGGGTITATGR